MFKRWIIMKDTILKLWNGDICPADDFKVTEEYKELQQKLAMAEEKLLENAGEEVKKYLEQFDDVLIKMGHIDENYAFYQGFSLGVKLVFEALE